MQNHLLFSRISELIFTPPSVALLDAGIVPQFTNGINVRVRECADRLVIDRADQLGFVL